MTASNFNSGGAKRVRIGGGAAFWGDSAVGPQQLADSGEIDYLILDYLAEITMSLLARARAKDAALGYATDFPEVLARIAPRLKQGNIKLVTNAGGVNPRGCQAMVEQRLKALGIDLKVGVVVGDDLMPRAQDLAGQELREMFTGDSFPDKPWSINAYLGAFPIAAALAVGADIVITGRCVDSALALGPLVHEFNWPADDYQRLAAGSLAGHVIECGAQATGGITTDWRDVADDWDRMGYPIADCTADGSFVLTKPAGTGGRVTPQTVAEQIVYEIGDPGAYLLPDVNCDFRQLRLTQVGPDRVEVRGAAGSAPGADYKVSLTYQDGFRSTGTMMIGGADAVAKAHHVAQAILARTRRLMAERGQADYRRTDVEVLGAEANYGPHSRAGAAREVILKVAVHHDSRAGLETFTREFMPPASSMAQGITGFIGGRPAITPLVRLYSFLVPKGAVPLQVEVGGVAAPLAVPAPPSPIQALHALQASPAASAPPQPRTRYEGETISAPLLALAYGRSGDKGDSANIGILARRPEFVPFLRQHLTAAAVKTYFAHLVTGTVERYEIPGLGGFNFLMHQALGGGGMASLRYDAQGKMLAQMLLDMPLAVPAAWIAKGPAQSEQACRAAVVG